MEARTRIVAHAVSACQPHDEASCLQVPYMVMICMRRQALPEKVMPEWEEMCAVSSAVQNLWLAATAHGIAGMQSYMLRHAVSSFRHSAVPTLYLVELQFLPKGPPPAGQDGELERWRGSEL